MWYEIVTYWDMLDNQFGIAKLAMVMFGTIFVLWIFSRGTKTDSFGVREKSTHSNFVEVLRFTTTFVLAISITYIVLSQINELFSISLLPQFTGFISEIIRTT